MVLIDANILAYLLIEGDKTATAQELFSADDDWRSDLFVLVEFSNVLATAVRTRRLQLNRATSLVSEAEQLMRQGLFLISNQDALRLAARYSVSAYDARYLAAAENLGVRLVTEDAKLRAAAPALTMSLAEALAAP